MEKFFLEILNMSITAGYCVIVVVLLRFLLKKLPKIYSYILWSVVFFRLICPVSIKSVFSLLHFNNSFIPEDFGLKSGAGVNTGYGISGILNNTAGNDANTVNNAAGDTVNQTVADITSNVDSIGAAGGSILQNVLSIAALVWIVVAVGLIIYSIISAVCLKKKLKGAVHKEANIYEVVDLSTPFVFGLINPRIYLPGSLTEPERSFVLKHELTHLRRKDYIIKPLAFVIVCMHWFNPLAWLAFYLMSKDMEMSCDESVIAKLTKAEKADYSQTLLTLASGSPAVGLSPLAFGEGNVKGRIKNVLHYKKPVMWITVVVVVVLAVILIGLAVNPKDNEPSDNALEQETSSEGDISTEEIEVLSEFEDSTEATTTEITTEAETDEVTTAEIIKDKVFTMEDVIEMSENATYRDYNFNEYINGELSPFSKGLDSDYTLMFDLDYNSEKYTIRTRYVKYDYGMDLISVSISSDKYPYNYYLYHEMLRQEGIPDISAMLEGYDFSEDVSYELPDGLTGVFYEYVDKYGIEISYRILVK